MAVLAAYKKGDVKKSNITGARINEETVKQARSRVQNMSGLVEALQSTAWTDAATIRQQKQRIDQYEQDVDTLRRVAAMSGSTLPDQSAYIQAMREALDNRENTFGKFETADAYHAYIKEQEKAQEDYKALLGLDLATVQKEIDDLDAEIQDMENRLLAAYEGYVDFGDFDFGPTAGTMNVLGKKEAYAKAIDQLIEQRKAKGKYYSQAKTAQLQQGRQEQVAAWQKEALESPELDKYIRLGEQVLANVTGMIDRKKTKPGDRTSATELLEWKSKMDTMKEEERQTFLYYLGMDSAKYSDAKKAQADPFGIQKALTGEAATPDLSGGLTVRDAVRAKRYLQLLEDTMNQRAGDNLFEDIERNTGTEMLFGVWAGLDQFASGMENLGNVHDDYIPPSGVQYASAKVREDLKDNGFNFWYNFKTRQWESEVAGSSLGQLAYDGITTTANMVPSILASYAANFIVPGSGTYVGPALLGASAAGNAYQEAINSGYDKTQARVYSTLIGASEALLERYLGKIPGLSKSDDAVMAFIKGLDSGFAQFAAYSGWSGLREGTEEAVQSVLEPFFRNLSFDETHNEVDWEEMAYSGILGFLTGTLMNGGEAAANVIANKGVLGEMRNIGKAVLQNGKADALIEMGLQAEADSALRQAAENLQGKKKKSATSVGELYTLAAQAAAEKQVAAVTPLIREELESRGEVSREAATALAKYVSGLELSDEERGAIGASPAATAMMQELDEARAHTGKQENPAENGGVQYSIKNTRNMPWIDQINGALQRGRNIKRNDTLVAGDVSSFLVSDGVSQKPLAIPLSVITKAQSGKDASHSISDDHLKALYTGLLNAPIVIDNPVRNALVYVTDISQDGKPIVVSFQKDATFDGDVVHKATSIHLQMDLNSMLKALPAAATVYVRNENELHGAVGVTNNLRSLSANVKFIPSTTVPQSGAGVNSQFMQETADYAPAATAMMQELDEARAHTGQQENPAEDGGVQYSIKNTRNMPLDQQLQQVESKTLNGSNSLYIGVPSQGLQHAGLSDAPLAMNQSDYRKSRREAANNKNHSSHAVPLDFFENIQQHIQDAVMFIDNGTKVTVITSYEMTDTKGNPSYVIAGIWKNQQMEGDTVNQIKSVYPLDDCGHRITAAAETGKLVITNKSKAEQMLATIGVQPSEVSRIVSLAKGSLSQDSGYVKTKKEGNSTRRTLHADVSTTGVTDDANTMPSNTTIPQSGAGVNSQFMQDTAEYAPADSGVDVQYSIENDRSGQYVKVDTDQAIFDGKTTREMQVLARNIIKERFKGLFLAVGENGEAYVNKRSAEEYTHPANRRMPDDIKQAKMRASTELDNLLKVSQFLENQPDDGRHPDAIGGWDVYATRFEIAGEMFTGQVKIKKTENGPAFYDVGKIKRLPTKSESTVSSETDVAIGNLSNTTIPQSGAGVNSQFMQETADYAPARWIEALGNSEAAQAAAEERFLLSRLLSEGIQKRNVQNARDTLEQLMGMAVPTTKDQQAVIDMGRQLGYTVTFGDVYVRDAEGNTVSRNGKKLRAQAHREGRNITIDQYAENPVRELLHEVLHTMQLTEGFSTYLVGALKSNLFQAYVEKQAEKPLYKAWLEEHGYAQATQANYRQYIIEGRLLAGDPNFVGRDRNTQERNANREMLADFVPEVIFRGKSGVEQLLRDMDAGVKVRFVQRIRDAIKMLWMKLRRVDVSTAKELRGLQREFEILLRKCQKEAQAAESGTEAAESENPAENGGVDRQYSLGEYSESQIENWKSSKKILVYQNNAQLSQFVDDSLNDPNYIKKMYFGTIDGELAERIKADTGHDFSGKNAVLRADNVRKILKDHGNPQKERPKKQTAIEKKDFLAIRDIFGKPDIISNSAEDYDGKPAVLFKKTIGSKNYVMVVVDSGGSLDIFVQTMYSPKNKGSIANVTNAKALIHTPMTSVGTAPNTTIPQNGAGVNTQSMQDTGNDAQENPTGDYSINPDFQSELQQWVDAGGTDTNTTFTVGHTSDVLQSIGVKSQDVKMRSGMIVQKMKKHPELTYDTFRDLPELLEHPILIQFSDAIAPETNKPKYDSRITVLGELYADVEQEDGTVKKAPVLVSIELLPTNQKNTRVLDFHVITSAYAKDALQNYINENSILYIEPDKKRTSRWLSLNRLQLPLGETKTGSIRKIAYSDGKVKIENSTKKTPFQMALEKAGAIDSYGNSIFDNTANDAQENSSGDYSISPEAVVDKKIVVGMPDAERAELLRHTVLPLAECNREAAAMDSDEVRSLVASYNSKAAKILRVLGEKFGVFKAYTNENVSLDFDYTKTAMSESVHKQGHISKNFSGLAKLLSVFNDVVRAAVPIEVHTDKYAGTKRANARLKQDYVLLSAFTDSGHIIPVEFHIKEMYDDLHDRNKLYVAITLGKIKIGDEVKVHRSNPSTDGQTEYTHSSPTISIPDLVSKINPEFGNFFKYLPDELLTEEQRASKEKAVEEERLRLASLHKAGGEYSISPEDVVAAARAYENGEIDSAELEQRLREKGRPNPLEIGAEIPGGTPDRATLLGLLPSLRRPGPDKPGAKERASYQKTVDSPVYSEDITEAIQDADTYRLYKNISNKGTLQKAQQAIYEGLAEKGEAWVWQWMNKGTEEGVTAATAVDMAIARLLAEMYRERGDVDSQLAILEHNMRQRTATAQALQAAKLEYMAFPEAVVAKYQHDLDQLFENAKEGKTKKWIEENKDKYKLTEGERSTIYNLTLEASHLPPGREKTVLLATINQIVSNKAEPELWQGVKAWQRICMLLNAKTNVRNVVSNATVVPVFMMADVFGNILDKAIAKKTGVRTTGLFGSAGWQKAFAAFGQGLCESYDDFKRKINTRGIREGRYEFDGGRSFKGDGGVANFFNELDRLTTFLLDAGDRGFYQMWFMNSLNNQMQLAKVSEPTVEMLEVARDTALQRTWQDKNAWTQSANKVKQALNSGIGNLSMFTGGAMSYGLGDMLFKFTSTPANLAKAIADFSPIGLAKSISHTARQFTKKAENGTATALDQSQFVAQLSKGLVGTLIDAAILILLQTGVIALTGAGDEDKDVRAFEQYIQGMPSYAISMAGSPYFSFDWMQPLAAKLATFADVRDGQKAVANGEVFEAIQTALHVGGDVLAQQTFFSSLADFFSTNTSGIMEKVVNLMLGDTSVYVPQLFSQTANLFDSKRRETYDRNKLRYALNRLAVKIPGLRNLLPESVDVLGREIPNSQQSFFNAFINPANTYTDTSTPVTDELYRLYQQTGNKATIPRKASGYVRRSNMTYHYTTEEKLRYQRITGQTVEQAMEVALQSDLYGTLTDDQRVDFVTDLYTYAEAKAKADFVYPYEFMAAMYDGLTETKYGRMTDEQKKKLAHNKFMDNYYDDVEKQTNKLLKKAKAK